MPPRRKAGNERSELMAVLTCLITTYVAHGVPPSIPELLGNGMAAEYGLALTASALAASALATWRNALHPLCPSPARRRTPCPCISAPAPALTRLALLGQLTPARALSGRLRP